ncbi:NUDIX domain-containing protein, partial [Streptomyces brasiliscabiei]|uniref:NUDIX domain-containing protein n=1 Tax=Streptomyces brasiliscabiei TaxID=2736302 RepID=UPI0030145773
MLINRAGLIWIGQRQPKWVKAPIWQMPQGGLLPKEDPKAGALRELREETGVRHVEVIAEAPDWLTYEL